MKNILIIFAIFISALRLKAQTNAPIRLALVSETAEMFVAADVLTAELSGHKNLQLLERNEIEKVYREQGLSAGNKDYLKLGQVLGADGLLLMETAKEGTNQYLNLRLVAVKPGVVLVAERFSWPLENLTEWSATFAKHLGLFLPKLTVSRKDAIPVSVVNLRSAISSTDAVETERQLKLLLIQRLSREKELFVLERQKMQLLSGEKELKLDDSAFWNGSYLLDGVVDQNGYSQETITVNGRLTPPKEGTLLSFAVSGSRTNLVEVVNQLAAKVNAALKVNSSVKEWNAADEAVQYFVEAQWALRWGAYAEAQAAADSAWVLGKQDLACALVRVKAYLGTPNAAVIAEEGEIDRSIIDSSDASDRQATIHRIRNIFATHSGAVFGFGIGGIDYVLIDNLPEERNLYYVSHALELYREFSQTLPTGEPKANSAWYVLGVESLTAAAQILQRYYLVPKSQGNVADKLSELRASSRQVAGWISRSPSVHDSYFAANPDRDKERRTLMDNANIYSCKLNWGCFWQEKPEDCVSRLFNNVPI
jgi:TolB-like protein